MRAITALAAHLQCALPYAEVCDDIVIQLTLVLGA